MVNGGEGEKRGSGRQKKGSGAHPWARGRARRRSRGRGRRNRSERPAAEAGKIEDDSVEPRLPRLDFIGEEREVDAANLAVVLDPCGEVLR